MDEHTPETTPEAPKKTWSRAPKGGKKRRVKRKVVVKKATPIAETIQVEPMPEVKKHDVTAPWRQARVLDTEKISGYTLKWWNEKREGNLEKRLDEGWEYVRWKDLKKEIPRTINDPTRGPDTIVRRRELVLMKLSLDRKAARDKWQKGRSLTPQGIATQLENDMRQATGEKGVSYMNIQGG